MERLLEMAEHQLIGFAHAKKGYSLEDLVQSMGMDKEEWEELQIESKLNYLTQEQKDTITKFFQ